ncbi:imidazole glycerol phosphate synthase subunit HisH [Croceicoccus sp. F390]|uniref:Imidazole glycerol phosphate synthase subunit HisH n=1 Tax=Croceicoccus esteveae TaxID=3075597 RepID=A0ABU2ZE82_9SPHN|nr:imidazole glycerol phosphate synthase subunit HisH [Croceicoccus sp. F390]MDT0574915.1 imidazole glycerol phosphate synthase subunit HisH [Croceicoccus sp. F390]
MTTRLVVIDYGAGNLHSVVSALVAAGADRPIVTSDPEVVRRADRIVLPGVGAFGACAAALRNVTGMVEAMEARVRTEGVPFLGICVGMQLLARRGMEHGVHAGLGWIDGEVLPIAGAGNDREQAKAAQTSASQIPASSIKVPHMGWNDVCPTSPAAEAGLILPGEAYFLHSYHFVPADPHDLAALTDHGSQLAAAVARANIMGVQFHPEKSQQYGLGFLARFLDWRP